MRQVARFSYNSFSVCPAIIQILISFSWMFFSTVEGDLTVESVLSGVHYYRCHDYVELLATVHLLPEFIKQHPKVNTCTITVNVEDIKMKLSA